MLEKALFITKLFLDSWEKLLSEDVSVLFFIIYLFMTVFLGKFVSESTPLSEKQPHT